MMKTKRYKKKRRWHLVFFSLLGWWPSEKRKQPLIFLFGFLLEPGQRPLQDKPEFKTWAGSWGTKANAIRSSTEKRKTSKWKIQDFNQGGCSSTVGYLGTPYLTWVGMVDPILDSCMLDIGSMSLLRHPQVGEILFQNPVPDGWYQILVPESVHHGGGLS